MVLSTKQNRHLSGIGAVASFAIRNLLQIKRKEIGTKKDKYALLFCYRMSELKESMENQVQQNFQSGRTHPKRNIVIVALLVFIIAVAVVAYSMLGKGSNPAPIFPTFGGRILLDGIITVNANSIYYIEFSVPERSSEIQVSGNFTVTENNTIRVYVTDGKNFAPLSPDFSPYYDSGLLSTGSINATLPSGGKYYLVYNNYNYNYNYLPTSGKIVDTQVNLSYAIYYE